MRIAIPDTLDLEFEKRAAMDEMPQADWILAQLARIKEHRVKDRIVIVGRDAREALEKRLGGGALQSDVDLVEKVSRLARLKIGEIAVDFSPGQWEELQRRCERLGLDVEQEAQRIVTKISELFFDHVGV